MVVAAFAEKRTRRTCTSIKTGLSQEIRDLIAGKCLEPSLSQTVYRKEGGRGGEETPLRLFPPLHPRFLALLLVLIAVTRVESPYPSTRGSSRRGILFLLFFLPFSLEGRREVNAERREGKDGSLYFDSTNNYW